MARLDVFDDRRLGPGTKVETVSCALCNSTDARQVFDVPDRLFNRPEVRAILVRCQRCGLVYQNPRPTLAEMAQHYLPEYELYTPQPGASELAPALRLAYAYGMRKRRQFITRHQTAGHLLDVGCATGVFLDSMRASGGWAVQGVEISPEAAQIARDQYHLDVRTGTLEEAAFGSATFDVVTLWDVLEHLHHLGASLDEVWRILKPGGWLVLRVPNGACWDARLFGQYWAGLEPPRHLYVFTPKTLRAILEQHHFRLMRSSTASAAYTTFLLSLRFYLRDHDGSFGAGLLRVLYHPVFRVLSAPLFMVGSICHRGPQLVAVAQKISKYA